MGIYKDMLDEISLTFNIKKGVINDIIHSFIYDVIDMFYMCKPMLFKIRYIYLHPNANQVYKWISKHSDKRKCAIGVAEVIDGIMFFTFVSSPGRNGLPQRENDIHAAIMLFRYINTYLPRRYKEMYKDRILHAKGILTGALTALYETDKIRATLVKEVFYYENI